jgi:hypothetical protein
MRSLLDPPEPEYMTPEQRSEMNRLLRDLMLYVMSEDEFARRIEAITGRSK